MKLAPEVATSTTGHVWHMILVAHYMSGAMTADFDAFLGYLLLS